MQIYSLRLESRSKILEIQKVTRRILGHTVMKTFRKNIHKHSDFQLYAGHHVGSEAVVHLLTLVWSQDDFNVILLVDTDNAFN